MSFYNAGAGANPRENTSEITQKCTFVKYYEVTYNNKSKNTVIFIELIVGLKINTSYLRYTHFLSFLLKILKLYKVYRSIPHVFKTRLSR